MHLGIKTLAVPVSCNGAIERSGCFDRVVRTRIGSPYVIQAMTALTVAGETAVAGFEANGGFLLGTPVRQQERVLPALPTRDAVLPIVAALMMARSSGGGLSQCIRNLPKRYTSSDRISDIPVSTSRRILSDFVNFPGELRAFLQPIGVMLQEIDQTDGLRMMLEDDEILHFRSSGNAPELRCYAEAGSPARAELLTKSGLSRMKQFIEHGA
jgi:phosphomannomutase